MSKLLLSTSKKRSVLTGKNLLPLGTNSFLLEQIPFWKGAGVVESKRVVTKASSLVLKWLKDYQVQLTLVTSNTDNSNYS